MQPPELVTVYRSQGMLQAQVIRGKLESAGVPVFLKYESIGQVFGLTVDGLGLVQVQVPVEWAETAEALLSEGDGEDELAGTGPDLDMPGEPPQD